MTTATRVATAIAVLSIGSFVLSPVFAEDSTPTATDVPQSGSEERVNANINSKGTMQPSGTRNNPTYAVKPRVPETANTKNRTAKEDTLKTGSTASREAKMGLQKEKNDLKNLKEGKPMIVKQGLEMRIASREAKIDELRIKFATRQEELKEKKATREAALKKRLDNFKDQKKATIAAQVSTNLNLVNKNRTDEMNKHLGILTNILSKLQNIASESSAKGKDVTLVQTAIDNAAALIASAQQAVNTQAGNDYTVVATSESQIKIDVKAKRDQLEQDLKATHQTLKDARQGVTEIVKVFKSSTEGVTTNGQ